MTKPHVVNKFLLNAIWSKKKTAISGPGQMSRPSATVDGATPETKRQHDHPASCGWKDYPLVNLQKAMENHHFEWENQLLMAIFNYQRVSFAENTRG